MSLPEKTKAPDFAAEDQSCKTHQLNEYQGKWVLLYFYPKDNTPGWTKEACQIRDNFGELQKRVTVLGVSPDDAKTHAKFAKKYNLPFSLLADPQKKIIKSYEANGLLFTKRISYLIDPLGLIAKVYEKVEPAKHAGQILLDLKALQTSPNTDIESK